jgi:hypothetical protein
LTCLILNPKNQKAEKAAELSELPIGELRLLVDEIEANLPQLRARQKALYLESVEELTQL